eukprot:Nitzschia sp. Nitz4//scaffold77_size91520//28950//30164//NITZ4_004885-RA/size91520-processed-gene-0.106-mRNA-1//-1//CDS//3329557976//5330//frame0
MKAPTKHGLDRKFKPWRRGKSDKSNKRSSLKQHLRGLERLLKKVSPDDHARRQELESQIQSVKSQIDEKQSVLQEKKHAEKAHGQRFLDRQRLTRQEKQVRKKEASSKNGATAEELFKIALDEVYVAHHPNDIKYMPLFRKGDRVTDSSRALFRRAVTRARILRELASKSIEIKPASWISKDQYDRLPKEWSIQDEERVFGGSISRTGKAKGPSAAKSDSRFALASNHDAVLEEAAKIDAALDEVEEVGESSSSEDEDSDDDDDADPLQGGTLAEPTKPNGNAAHPEASSSSDDDSSDDESTSPSEKKDATVTTKRDNNDDDDDSSSSSDSSVGQEEEPPTQKPAPSPEPEEVDDFLMEANQEDDNVFSMTLKQVPAMDTARGDKSKGWESQRQRPFQKRQRRR